MSMGFGAKGRGQGSGNEEWTYMISRLMGGGHSFSLMPFFSDGGTGR
jgi:hypothetical protein